MTTPLVILQTCEREHVRLTPEQIDRLYAEWDPALHPRHEAGDERGGEFAPKNEMRDATDADKERLKALKLRPDLKNIRLSVDPNARLQATGEDSKGRTQYIYSAEHSAKQSAEKFERLRAFDDVQRTVESKSLRDMRGGSDAAAALYVISQTGLRVGSTTETRGASKAYGVTTLLGAHVKVEGDTVHFKFPGKSGVLNEKSIENAPLASLLKSRALKDDEPIFKTSDEAVRAYMKQAAGDAFKVKDYRTWHGTSKAMEAISREMKTPPTNAREREKVFARVKKEVAAHLGNTPAVAFKYYIAPEVWDRLKAVK